MKKTIGFIGLGEMGFPMAVNLLKAGYSVIAYDKRNEVLATIKSQGARIARSVSAMAKNAKIVICMPRTTEQVAALLKGKDGLMNRLRPGSIVVVMATVDTLAVKEFAKQALEKGIRILDAPVSGARIGAETGTLTIMAGGPEEAFLECRSIFEVLGENIYYIGDSGKGAMIKLLNQQLLLVNMNVVYEVMALAKEAGIKPDLVKRVIENCTGNSWVLKNWDMVEAWRIRYKPEGTLDTMYKDAHMTLKIAETLKVPLQLTALSSQLGRYDGRRYDLKRRR
jgi:3-hydroxyisobutyrate dehydrogenase-like beta-hydroxyacid dehydrogenase